MEKLLHMAVIISAGATAVWLFSQSQLNARSNGLFNEEIDEIEPKPAQEEEDAQEDEDVLDSFWAGDIPEGTAHFISKPSV